MVCAQSLGHADRETKRASSRIPAGDDVPAGTLAVVRSSLALRCSTEQNALHTSIHQRHLTPSCGGHAPTAERTLDPARTIRGELDPRPGIREQPGSIATFWTGAEFVHIDTTAGKEEVTQPPASGRRAIREEPTGQAGGSQSSTSALSGRAAASSAQNKSRFALYCSISSSVMQSTAGGVSFKTRL